MLLITIPPAVSEEFDDQKEEFIYKTVFEGRTLELEHSLVSLSQWESKWCKPFLSEKDKTDEELLDYIKFMTLTPNVEPEVYGYLTARNIEAIKEYIKSPMTATTFSDTQNDKHKREVITAEIIYYWMISLGIDFECQYWHLNRLITLVRVCNIKNKPPSKKKKSGSDTALRYAQMNAARKRKPRG